jgi:hypothetical protein
MVNEKIIKLLHYPLPIGPWYSCRPSSWVCFGLHGLGDVIFLAIVRYEDGSDYEVHKEYYLLGCETM